jgi:dinuclear metal center YbgI/SA1388 family protein
MIIKEIINYLETIAPLSLQESYDNSGLLTGNVNDDITGVLITLDTTEEVVMEAVKKKANLIISHHPFIFKGIKKLTGTNYVEKTLIKAIKNDIAVYALHTNLDNVQHGVNDALSRKLNLKNCKILKVMNEQLMKLVTFVPLEYSEKVQQSLFNAGAGHIGNYDNCSFTIQGTGSYRAGENTKPFRGEKTKMHYEPEIRIETVFPKYLKSNIINALISAHPYEEVAYDIYTLNNVFQKTGAGIVGELEPEQNIYEFLKFVKNKLNAQMIKHTEVLKKNVKKIAICGGSGSFLLQDAVNEKADVFISSDFKYHDYFDADKRIMIIDAGHYETEQFTKELIFDLLIKKFNTFACYLTEINTNPINYI